MQRVKIFNKNNVITHQADFETLTQANAWISEHQYSGAWGKNVRELSQQECLAQGENIANAISSRQVVVGQQEITMYTFEADFEIEIIDVEGEYDDLKRIQYGLAAQNLGMLILAKVQAINEKKIELDQLSAEQFGLILADETMARIERCLQNGSLKTAKSLINSLSTIFFSAEDKAKIIAEIDAFLIKNNKI